MPVVQGTMMVIARPAAFAFTADQCGIRIGRRNVRIINRLVIFGRAGVIEFGFLRRYHLLVGGDKFRATLLNGIFGGVGLDEAGV